MFSDFCSLVEKVDAEPSHSEKQAIFTKHFKAHKVMLGWVLFASSLFVLFCFRFGFFCKSFQNINQTIKISQGDANELYLLTKLVLTREVSSVDAPARRTRNTLLRSTIVNVCLCLLRDVQQQDARKYNMKEKGVCKMLARVWHGVAGCDNDALVKDMTEKGDIGTTARTFHERLFARFRRFERNYFIFCAECIYLFFVGASRLFVSGHSQRLCSVFGDVEDL